MDDADPSRVAETPFTMLHLGLGSFHRAHQAVYQQALHDRGDFRWQLAGGNIRADMVDLISSLQRQGGAYTLETITPAGQHRYQRIEAIRTVVPFVPGLAPLIAIGAWPTTRVVSFTVTEAGYYLDSHETLDTSHPDIAEDLAAARRGETGGARGATIYGALVGLLRERLYQVSGPVTLLCCDNLRHNGKRSRHGLEQFIEALGDDDLLDFVRTQTSSPDCMVDRITPRPAPEVRVRASEATGVDDPTAVMGESFIQWVIEDRFVAGRPDWAAVDVELVGDVAPYEEAKIRILNASHSCIAWAGTLIGYSFIHEGARDPVVRRMAHDYVTNDVIPCLEGSPVDLPTYRDVVLERFENPAIRDTNQRVAMDGFAKIPGFIAPTVRERIAADAPIDSVATLPALFLAFLQRWHRDELPYDYQDQAMDPAVAHAICSAADPLIAFVADTTLWGELAGDPRLVSALRAAQTRVEQFVSEHRQ